MPETQATKPQGRGAIQFSYARAGSRRSGPEGDTLIVGPKAALVRALEDGSSSLAWFTQSGHISSVDHAATTAQLRAIVKTLRPGADVTDAAVAETVCINENGEPRRVVLCALPTRRSRHNSPAHPHAICDFVRSKATGNNALSVVVVLGDDAHAFAAASAAARAFPHFSAKGAFGTTSMGGVGEVVKDYATEAAVGASGPPRHVEIVIHESATNMNAPLGVQHTTMLKALGAVSKGITLAARLVDAPTNYMHTGVFVDEARRVVAQLEAEGVENLSITVIEGAQLVEQGFGLLWGVGKAAVNLPALVVISHNASTLGEGSAASGVALCGKGIVYDTGGLSIKGKTFMPGMKRDMGGAATVLASWQAIARLGGLPGGRPLHCVLCLAENAVGPEATRPDDIHTGYSGKTVEVTNTDAEGRLVLGDGVAYAASVLRADTIVDAATLTGAQGIATGKRHAAIYCSSEASETATVRAGQFSGDLTHPLPFAPEFFRHEFRSVVADMSNNVRDRANAQASCAAQFIGNHLPDGWLDQTEVTADATGAGEEGTAPGVGTWIHIDMAAPVCEKTAERATGYGVGLLASLCGVVPGAPGGL